jgi:hypothetical protein
MIEPQEFAVPHHVSEPLCWLKLPSGQDTIDPAKLAPGLAPIYVTPAGIVSYTITFPAERMVMVVKLS